MAIKNNVTRFLDAKKVTYVAHELPNEKLGAIEAAQHLSIPPEQMFKTIVLLREGRGKPILALVSGPQEVDLKALAKAVGEKKVVLATHAQAEQITHLQTGGISPLALLNKGFEIVIDETAALYPQIFVSGGQRGLNIELNAKDLIQLIGANMAQIGK